MFEGLRRSWVYVIVSRGTWDVVLGQRMWLSGRQLKRSSLRRHEEKNRGEMLVYSYNSARDVHGNDEEMKSYVPQPVSRRRARRVDA